MSNDFKTNAEKSRKKYPSKKLKVLLNLSIFFLIFLSIWCIFALFEPWEDLLLPLVRGLMAFISISFAYIMIQFKISEKPGWEILAKTFKLMAWVLIIFSFIVTHLTPDKKSLTGFNIVSTDTFTLADGGLFLTGSIYYTFALIFEEGREMENELEEIL